MAGSKAKNSSTKPEDEEVLKSEVASFASSLGLSSTLPSSGFNDSDFRKTGRLKANTPAKKQKQSPGKKPSGSENLKGRNSNPNEKSKPKPPVLAIDDNDSNPKVFEKYKNLPKLPLVKASAVGSWYVDAEELEAKLVGDKQLGVKNVEEWRSVVEKKRELGKRLMAQFSQDYVSSRGQSGDIKMLITTQRSGTAADKVSAFSVMVGDNPIANLRSLDALIGMVTSKVGKRHALTGFEALRELFVSSLLPDRKLKTLLQRPLNHLPDNKDGYSLLLFWYWEECLKQRYERFIFALEEASRDMLPVLKQKALKNIYALLKSKSEQERRLLSALVNKLGDPESKGASNADYHLSNLLSDHPNMKAVVIDEVDSFLFRPRLGLRAKYHAVNFLSQIRLSNKEDGPKVAKRLVDVYFALFKVLITEGSSGQKIDKSLREDNRKSFTSSKNKKEDLSESHIEMDSRLLSTLLTGINRAFPFVLSDGADDVIEVQTPMLFQLVHSKNFNVGVQALLLLDKISSKNQVVSDRFYRALYSKLLLPAALSSSKAEMFIGLLLRAMKNDVNLKRVAAFAKRILQVALQQQPQYACGYLFLISEVLKARPPLWNLVLQNESIDEELEHFEDIEEETNNEPSTAPEELESDVKLLQNNNAVLSDRDSSEDENDSPASSSEEDDEDEAEEFQINNDDNEMEVSKITPVNNGQKAQVPSNNFLLPGGYEPRHREPSYCNADCVSWWELSVLASHTHPSVSTMARTILSGTNIVYNGNPLHDLSLTAFLDKFMEKKPKQTTWHGGSQIEPAKKLDMNNHLIGPEILSLAEDDVPPEDLVFHKFYTFKMNTSNKTKKKKKKKGSEEEAAEELFDVDGDGGDGDDGDDESDNEEIDNLLESNLSVEAADGDYDYDDLDRVANEDDENLTGNVSDEDIDVPSDLIDGEELDACFDDADEDMVETGDEAEERSDVEEDERLVERKKRKRKNGKSGVSPFASLEDYEHLLEDGGAVRKEDSTQKKKSTRKKRS